jgi:hypothetical protein
MPLRTINLPFPLKGLSEALSSSDQPPGTTPEMINARTLDPVTKRYTGAMRAGSEFYVTDIVGAGPVRDVTQVIYDGRHTDYAAIETTSSSEPLENPSVEWSVANPALQSTQRLALDLQGNVYGLSGPVGVAKWNPKGTMITSWEVPVSHRDQRLRALSVDEFGAVYTATSAGPQGQQPKIWKYVQREDGSYAIAWAFNVLGYVPDLFYRDGRLYVLENRASQALPDGLPSGRLGTAFASVYDSLDATEPRKLLERAVPFPAMQITVNAAGDFFVASLPNDLRGVTEASACSMKSVDWTPEDLTSYSTRIWTWLDATMLVNYAEGDDITFWEDRSGKGRNLYHASETMDPNFAGILPPEYAAGAFCDMPAVRFNGENGLNTAPTINADNDPATNLSLLPTVDYSTWAFFMLLAPARGGTSRQCVLEQWGELKLRILANVDDAAPTTVAPGALWVNVDPVTDAGGASATTVDAGSYVTDLGSGSPLRNDVAILTIVQGGDDVTDESIVRINGVEVDRFTMTRDQIRYGTFLGFSQHPDQPYDGGDFEGDVAEMLTLYGAVTDAEIEEVEGYLAHKWGMQHVLDSGHTYASTPPGAPSGGSSGSSGSDPDDYQSVFISQMGTVIKFSPTTGTRWGFTGAGVGFAVALDDTTGVYNAGRVEEEPSGGSSGSGGPGYDVTVRKIIDGGSSYTLDWTLSSAEVPQNDYLVRMKVDGAGNLWLPNHVVGTPNALYKIDETGAVEWVYDTTPARVSYDVTFAPAPDYGDDTIGEPEFVYLATFNGGVGAAGSTVWKLRVVRATFNNGSPRARKIIGIAGGDVVEIVPATDSIDTITGGTGAVRDGRFITTAVLFGEVFIIDGEKVLVYRPKTDVVVPYVPTSPGSIPERPRLMIAWRGALLFARFDGDAHNWFLTQRGDPYNVDLAPPVVLNTTAVIGNDSRPGVCPDIINALIPWDDDLLVFGGDHSIHRLTGDPMAGGEFDLITDQVGIAFGRAHCRDEQGRLYFLAPMGGVYRLDSPLSKPVDITADRIRKRLEDIRLDDFDVKMGYNPLLKCVDLIIAPIEVLASGGSVTGAVASEHYCYEVETDAWSTTEFYHDSHNPSCLFVLDGDDPEDRVAGFGRVDGHAVFWSAEVSSDEDAEPAGIESSVLIGPFMAGDGYSKIRLQSLKACFATEQDGVRWEVLGSDSPDEIPDTARKSGTFSTGQTTTQVIARATAPVLWVRLFTEYDPSSGSEIEPRWSLVYLKGRVFGAGRSRP